MSMITLYFFVMLDSINTMMGVLCGASAFGGGVGFIVCVAYLSYINDNRPYDMTSKDYTKFLKEDESYLNTIKMKKAFFKVMIICPIIFGLLATLLPTTKQMAFIYIVAHMSQSEVANKIGEKAVAIPDKALEVLNIKLDEYLAEMKGTTDKVKGSAEQASDTIKKTSTKASDTITQIAK